MKTIILSMLLITSLMVNANTSLANRKLHMPSNGYWVVESEADNPDFASVYFYDHQNNRIHSETIIVKNEKFLNKKLKRKLNKKLVLLLEEKSVEELS